MEPHTKAVGDEDPVGPRQAFGFHGPLDPPLELDWLEARPEEPG
jgi:hypothetical protein